MARLRQNRALNVADDKALPDGWCWVRLGDITEIVMGNSPPGSSYNQAGRGMPLINGPTEFGPGPLDHPRIAQYTESPSKFCEPGDLLICVRGSTTGRTNVASFRAAIGRGIAATRSVECQPYINQYVASRADMLLSVGTGSTFPNITLAQLMELAIPLPPLDEQHAIVAAIQEAVTDIDAGVAALKRAEADLTQLRAAVLRDAFTGDLTRAKRPVHGEEGKEILRRILAERRKRWEAQQAKEGMKTLFGPEGAFEQGNLPSDAPDWLPKTWGWATLGHLCDIQLGRAKNPSNRPGKYSTKYLRAANITEEGLNLTNVYEMDFPPKERETYRLRRGDLVVSEASGSPDQVGKPAIWNDELPLCCFQNTVIRLRPMVVESDYILVLLQHCYFNRVFADLSAGVGINHLGAKRLAQIGVPVAPSAEEKLIVREVAEQLAAARNSRATIKANLVGAEQLRKSVLSRAFSGQLVPSPPLREEASTLATRIAERLRVLRSRRPARLSERKSTTMIVPPKRRPLLDVLREHPKGISPEDLRVAAQFSLDEVDDFYTELSEIADKFIEEKPSGDEAFKWPVKSRVLIRLKAR